LHADLNKNIADEFLLFANAQYIKEQGIGAAQNTFTTSNPYSNYYCSNAICHNGIDSSYGAIKVGTTYKRATLYAAYSETVANTNAMMDGSLMLPWGGFTTTLFTANMMANPTAGGTKATKMAIEYNFNEYINGLSASYSYAIYAANSSCTYAFTTGGPIGGMNANIGNIGFSSHYGRIKYQFNKQLNFDIKVEKDTLMGQAPLINSNPSAPNGVLESRVVATYLF
jgi:hypothetical protein